MLAKQLTFLAGADAAGIVLGARVPIILTSRADSAAHPPGVLRRRGCWPPTLPTPAARQLTMADAILVINAGSSSIKFALFSAGQ